MEWWGFLIIMFFVVLVNYALGKWSNGSDARIDDLEDRISELENKMGPGHEIEIEKE